MISDLYTTYQFIKEVTKDIRGSMSGFKDDITYLSGDRWIADRNTILGSFTFSDVYLSISYVKGKDGKSRYWSKNSTNAAKKFEKQLPVLLRRLVIFEDGIDKNSVFVTDRNEEVPVTQWLEEQKANGADILTVSSSTLLNALEKTDAINRFTDISIRDISKKQNLNDEIPVEFFNQLERGDAHLMDIGIYGLSAVGFQVTNDMGEPIGFFLSKKDSDVIDARKYFNLLCNYAERYVK